MDDVAFWRCGLPSKVPRPWAHSWSGEGVSRRPWSVAPPGDLGQVMG